MLVLALGACAPAPLWAQHCGFMATVPAGWQRVDTVVAALQLPRDAYAKRGSATDGGSERYVADGLDVFVDYGPAESPREPEQGTVSRLLGGAPAFILSEAHTGDAGRIAITWAELGNARVEASVTIDYADASRRTDACHIASSLRLLGHADRLMLVRTGRSGGARYAVLRDERGDTRRVAVGDYVALNWGKVTRIDDAAVEVTQRVVDARGRWSDRPITLRRAR